MKRGWKCGWWLAGVLLLGACGRQAPAPVNALPASHPPLDDGAAATPALPPETVLARAGDVVITVADADAARALMPAGDRLEIAASAAAVDDFVRSLVDQRLMAAAARRDGMAQDLPAGSADEQRRELARRWLDAELGHMPMPSAADVEAYYRSHRGMFAEPARVRASRVVAQDEAGARRARSELARGAPVEEARRQAGPGAQAGELWLQDVPGAIPLEADAVKLMPGAVGEVGAVAGGFAVLRVEEQRPARVRPFDEVREGIRIRLADEARQLAADAARKRLRGDVAVVLEPAAMTSYAAQLGRGG